MLYTIFFDIVCVKLDFTYRFPCVKFLLILCVKMHFTHGKRCVKSNFRYTMSKTLLRYTNPIKRYNRLITSLASFVHIHAFPQTDKLSVIERAASQRAIKLSLLSHGARCQLIGQNKKARVLRSPSRTPDKFLYDNINRSFVCLASLIFARSSACYIFASSIFDP